jgi:D-3-phosphoglycerate dehydrogenase
MARPSPLLGPPPACTAHGVLLCSNMHSDTPSYAAAEHTLALILASYRQIPQQMTFIKAGQWQSGVGRTLRGRTLGLYGYGRIARAVAAYAKAMGLKVQWWGSEAGARGPLRLGKLWPFLARPFLKRPILSACMSD